MEMIEHALTVDDLRNNNTHLNTFSNEHCACAQLAENISIIDEREAKILQETHKLQRDGSYSSESGYSSSATLSPVKRPRSSNEFRRGSVQSTNSELNGHLTHINDIDINNHQNLTKTDQHNNSSTTQLLFSSTENLNHCNALSVYSGNKSSTDNIFSFDDLAIHNSHTHEEHTVLRSNEASPVNQQLLHPILPTTKTFSAPLPHIQINHTPEANQSEQTTNNPQHLSKDDDGKCGLDSIKDFFEDIGSLNYDEVLPAEKNSTAMERQSADREKAVFEEDKKLQENAVNEGSGVNHRATTPLFESPFNLSTTDLMQTEDQYNLMSGRSSFSRIILGTSPIHTGSFGNLFNGTCSPTPSMRYDSISNINIMSMTAAPTSLSTSEPDQSKLTKSTDPLLSAPLHGVSDSLENIQSFITNTSVMAPKMANGAQENLRNYIKSEDNATNTIINEALAQLDHYQHNICGNGAELASSSQNMSGSTGSIANNLTPLAGSNNSRPPVYNNNNTSSKLSQIINRTIKDEMMLGSTTSLASLSSSLSFTNRILENVDGKFNSTEDVTNTLNSFNNSSTAPLPLNLSINQVGTVVNNNNNYLSKTAPTPLNSGNKSFPANRGGSSNAKLLQKYDSRAGVPHQPNNTVHPSPINITLNLYNKETAGAQDSTRNNSASNNSSGPYNQIPSRLDPANVRGNPYQTDLAANRKLLEFISNSQDPANYFNTGLYEADASSMLNQGFPPIPPTFLSNYYANPYQQNPYYNHPYNPLVKNTMNNKSVSVGHNGSLAKQQQNTNPQQNHNSQKFPPNVISPYDKVNNANNSNHAPYANNNNANTHMSNPNPLAASATNYPILMHHHLHNTSQPPNKNAPNNSYYDPRFLQHPDYLRNQMVSSTTLTPSPMKHHAYGCTNKSAYGSSNAGFIAYNGSLTARSRDQRRAEALKIPFTIDEIIYSPIDEFTDMLRKHNLTDSQISLIRDIRRRGKNKVAAQNCRKRKIDGIVDLDKSVDYLRKVKVELTKEQLDLQNEIRIYQQKYNEIYMQILSSLRDENGLEYSENEYMLQFSSDGNLFLLPKNQSPLSNSPMDSSTTSTNSTSSMMMEVADIKRCLNPNRSDTMIPV